MPAVNGTIKRTKTGTEFVGSFTVEGRAYSFTGNTTTPGEPFETDDAELTYDSAGEITARHLFEGKIGTATVKFTMANGPVMQGTIKMRIDPASTVTGVGAWSQSDE